MAYKVLEKVLEQCRNALLGGTPIIYIKTDSDIFMRKLISYEKNPLVVLLSNGGSQSGPEWELNGRRPVYELPGEEDKRLKYCINYKNGLPSIKKKEFYDGMTCSEDTDVMLPVLWSYKMPETPEEQKNAFQTLEKYVIDHEDPRHPQYGALQSSVVLLYSSRAVISPMLRTYTEFVDVDYPDEEEIRSLLKSEAAGNPAITENEEYLSALCMDFSGFTSEEIEMTMKRIMTTASLEDSEQVQRIIRKRKEQKMEGGVLELCRTEGEIGGMENFLGWLDQQKDSLKKAMTYKRKTGTKPPKGILCCGIPGCGKSEAAKFTAQALGNLPLLKLDMGSLTNKFQGVSEERMREALKMAEAMSPCVLWFDELEKGLSGIGSGNSSSTRQNMFGYLLGWMQENQKPCFIFATANDIGGLPKEFFRNGRFEARFATYLPTSRECVRIFQACMRKAEKNKAKAMHGETAAIFEEECRKEDLLLGVIHETLVTSEGIPRAVIGSDIDTAVNTALRAILKEELFEQNGLVSGDTWKNKLKEVIHDRNFSVYGDSEENMESVAAGYCRMLRKGFLPTSDQALFESRDYHLENVKRYTYLRNKDVFSMDEKERERHEEELKHYEILQFNKDIFDSLDSAYDRAVYHYLRPRINEIAVDVERLERQRLIGYRG